MGYADLGLVLTAVRVRMSLLCFLATLFLGSSLPGCSYCGASGRLRSCVSGLTRSALSQLSYTSIYLPLPDLRGLAHPPLPRFARLPFPDPSLFGTPLGILPPFVWILPLFWWDQMDSNHRASG